jgi:hypothetical protein
MRYLLERAIASFRSARWTSKKSSASRASGSLAEIDEPIDLVDVFRASGGGRRMHARSGGRGSEGVLAPARPPLDEARAHLRGTPGIDYVEDAARRSSTGAGNTSCRPNSGRPDANARDEAAASLKFETPGGNPAFPP